MKRKLLLIFLMIPVILYSQDDKKFRFGMKICPNYNWIVPETNNYNNDGGTVGFGWGLIADINLRDNYYLSTGFGLSYTGGKLSYNTDYPMPRDNNSDTILTGKVFREYSFRYLEIPLLFKMKTMNYREFRFFGQMGLIPAFNLRTHADDVFYPTGGTSFQNEPDVSYVTNTMRLSVYIGGGVEYHFDKSTFLTAGLGFNNSFTDIFSGYNTRLKASEDAISNYLELSLGIIF